MDFPENSCKRALIHTNNRSTEDAVNWLVEHVDDPTLNDPLPAEGIKVNVPAPRASLINSPLEIPDTMDALMLRGLLLVRASLTYSSP